MKKMTLVAAGAASLVFSLPGEAGAHTFGAFGAGFPEGFWHPAGGIDHVLAMVAVGFWAAQAAGGAVWKLPLAFLAMMAAGASLAIAGAPLPYVEAGILASVIVLGAVVTVAWEPPLGAALALAGLFGVFHGHAHGAELPQAASALSYGAGFMLGTAFLHAAGLAIGSSLTRRAALRTKVLRAAGGAVSLAGVLLWMSG